VLRSPTLRVAGISALFIAAAFFGIASGVMFAFMGDLPGLPSLDSYAPSVTTRILGRHGAVIGELATERRELLKYSDIPPVLRQAIISSEDGQFFRHSGVNVRRTAMALAKDAARAVGIKAGVFSGASTITQQLARNVFPEQIGFNVSPERKIKELLVAFQIEKRYTKEEIFAMYCNQINMGHGAYGMAAAAEMYFGKRVQDLTLSEAALLAGIIQGNVLQSPYVNMKAAKTRQALTLNRMVAEGYINQAQADEAKAQPLVLRGYAGRTSIAPYFTEMVRQHLQEKYGAKAVYEGGLTVNTSIDGDLQKAANRALDTGLRRLDKLRGFRKPSRNLVAEKRDLDKFRLSSWFHEPQPGDILQAVVMGIDAGVIRFKYSRWTGTIDKAGYTWTRRAPDQLVRRGDVIDVLVKTLNPAALIFTAALDQPPALEGAILALDNKTGDILAMVGGSSYERSQFNRATQALRQVGSSFKPIVFTAAIDRGYTATSVLIDEPVSYPAGPGQPNYEPRNYDRQFEGNITLRHALEDSRNIPTIKLMAALGAEQVVMFARRFGITSPLPPYLPIAIGAGDASLLEMTSAYTTFPNQGVRMTPQAIKQVLDKDGTVLEETRPEAHDVIRADTSYVMTYLMQGVVERGTGRPARVAIPNWPLGGKTGTTDDYTDAWFIGFDPDITIGVWVGFDQKKPIGQGQTGTVAALPIWIDVMKSWVDERRATLKEVPSFTRPGGVVLVETANGVEAFIAGTEPVIR
jgi:penicillin-binding protein 1A